MKIWIARDLDDELYFFHIKPMWKKTGWREPLDRVTEAVRLSRDLYPEIGPGEIREFAEVIDEHDGKKKCPTGCCGCESGDPKIQGCREDL